MVGCSLDSPTGSFSTSSHSFVWFLFEVYIFVETGFDPFSFFGRTRASGTVSLRSSTNNIVLSVLQGNVINQ